ncbi:MAG: heme NO-binding domain-containing protein [Planctomycetaceae bacterium]|jgi:hypothetical protein|nr:heme NO-binding domain-containing protein [Planctomycetaceae bacterium]MBT6158180.1 heme NO-binding domain-containing protein [Planctomycetaceae bacterium]MBT6487656.1 heme NO-binding domain-containing protein [Planctomycetaceae bacterium]MBT6497324.1 heme NO-binding domain-containing protein [Planctomycetaceae bacterium]
MKGVIFSEFLEMVEEEFSLKIADRIIEASNLESGGAYTSVGTYDKDEIIRLVTQLSQETGVEVPALLCSFGRHLFGRFHENYHHFFDGVETAFQFLQNIEGYIHVEVLKLYPDAELPAFDYESSDPNELVMIYHSARPFADLAEGLIAGCADHFGETLDIKREDRSHDNETCVRFVLTKRGG